MQRLEVSGAVRPIYRSLGVKGLRGGSVHIDPEVELLASLDQENKGLTADHTVFPSVPPLQFLIHSTDFH